MKKTAVKIYETDIPETFRSYIKDAFVFDSSSSPEARVYYIDKDRGLYLKRGKKGSLEREELMASYYNDLGLGVRVVGYLSDSEDWLLTESAIGEDCTHDAYLSDPKRLCRVMAESLNMLHCTNYDLCPVKKRGDEYYAAVRNNYGKGIFDNGIFDGRWYCKDRDEAWRIANEYGKYLKNDTLIHGDYCLPNIILDNWNFSSFIDLGNGGVGDKHIDIFWGVWTLKFNLHTDMYADYFLDAYGREGFDYEMLRGIAAMECFG